ncbi:MAG TPA: hypothetical protein VLV78_03885 [Thermoanaerobaculia bacterium]|nr:hypothetical protein [Thermoanaerobaculia bacterium]
MRNVLAILLLASSASAADLPRYWSVHIDFATDRASYEKIDREFSDVQRNFYGEHHIDLPPVIHFSTPDGAYYGLRPRGSLSDFERPNPLGDAAKDLSAKLAPISAATHQLLRTHHNEIWRIDQELTNIRDERAPKYMLMRTDDVPPPQDEAYGTAMKELVQEAAAQGIGVVAFFSVYGDGSYRYLFLSDEPLKIRTLGKLARTRNINARPRPDLSGTDPAHWWSCVVPASGRP